MGVGRRGEGDRHPREHASAHRQRVGCVLKTTLEFPDSPDGEQNAKLAQNANKVYAALWDIDQWLREEWKYKDAEWAGEVRERFYQILGENGVDLEDYS